MSCKPPRKEAWIRAAAAMPMEFYDTASHYLPPELEVGPKGSRPRIANLPVLRVIWFVLATGCRWLQDPDRANAPNQLAF